MLKVQLKVPFEVFKRKSGKGSGKDQGKAEEKTHRSTAKPASEPLPSDNFKVLLFWIEEEAIAQQVGGTAQPLQKLNALIQGIASKAPCNTARVEAAILGPSNSDTLRAMVREVKAPTDWKLCPSSGAAGLGYPCGRLRNLVVYSPFATASGRYTLQLGDKPYAPCARSADKWRHVDWQRVLQENPRRSGSILHEYFQGCGLKFLSTIATDDELAQALVEEFARRGLEPPTGASSPGYTIAVVSEWDTYYGRMLPKSLMGQLGTTEEDCEDDPAENAGLSHPCRVLRYSYLRGLDGEQPAVGAEKAKAPESGKAGTPKQESEKAAAQDRRTDVLVRGHQHVAERADTAFGAGPGRRVPAGSMAKNRPQHSGHLHRVRTRPSPSRRGSLASVGCDLRRSGATGITPG